MKLKPIQKRVFRDMLFGRAIGPLLEVRLQCSKHFQGKLARFIAKSYDAYVMSLEVSNEESPDFLDVTKFSMGSVQVKPGDVVMLTGREIKIKFIEKVAADETRRKYKKRLDRGKIYLEVLVENKTGFMHRHQLQLISADEKAKTISV